MKIYQPQNERKKMNKQFKKQAEAELCQAQGKLPLIWL